MPESASPPWTQELQSLWQRLQSHPFESADALDFARRLAREHGWPLADARAAIDEYRRFCFLAIAAGQQVTPSDDVDEVWHLHLICSRDYWERFCPHVLGAPLHHGPTRGGANEDRKHREQYAATLAAYETFFGPPPERWWPSTHERFRRPQRFRRVDLERTWTIRKPSLAPLRRTFGAMAAALALTLVAVPAFARPLNPLDWNGHDFLQLYVVLLIVVAIATKLWRRSLRATGQGRGHALDLLETAYLAGGPQRATDAALVELHRRGDVQWAGNRFVTASDPQRVPSPLDRYARQVAIDGDPLKLRAAGLQLAAPVRQGLERKGFYVDRDTAARNALTTTLPLLALLGFGIAKIVVGVMRDKPVSLLVALCVVTAVLALIVFARRATRSTEGDAEVRRLQQKHATAMRAPRTDDLALAVALGGSAILAGTALGGFHERIAPSSPASSDSSSSSSSSGCSSSNSSDSGSSDSGGSSGCGGCGGGGD